MIDGLSHSSETCCACTVSWRGGGGGGTNGLGPRLSRVGERMESKANGGEGLL